MGDNNNEIIISNANTIVERERDPRELIDRKTGEIIYVDDISKRVHGQKNFWKCYLMDFLSVLGIIDSKQLDIFVYIAENTNSSTNVFIGTYKEISEATGTCRQTVATIMKKLQAANFVKKKMNGVWAVNPNILMKGNENKRQILLSYYRDDDKENEMSFGRSQQNELQTELRKNQANAEDGAKLIDSQSKKEV